MTLPASGSISLSQVNVELGLSSTASINMNASNVRTLFGKASGAISMSDGYGKSNRAAVSYTIGSNTANASINVASLSGYSAGTSDITITVNSGVYVYSTSTGTPGLTLTGGTTGDTITLVNNGFIMGRGGNGGPVDGAAGGPALSLGFNTTVNNTNGAAYIGGGGGGGGAFDGGGGGAGGGNGGGPNNGSGGAPGASGSNGGYSSASGTYGTYYYIGGGGGGRIFPGSGGAGGPGGHPSNWYGRGGGAGGGGTSGSSNSYGGAGGSSNNVGGTTSGGGGGGPYSAASAGGGGWGASGGTTYSNVPRLGGAGGKAVALNGRTVTWVSGDTARVWGAVS